MDLKQWLQSQYARESRLVKGKTRKPMLAQQNVDNDEGSQALVADDEFPPSHYSTKTLILIKRLSMHKILIRHAVHKTIWRTIYRSTYRTEHA